MTLWILIWLLFIPRDNSSVNQQDSTDLYQRVWSCWSMGTSGCGAAHYTLIIIPSLQVRSTEPLIDSMVLYINWVNVAEKSVKYDITLGEKAKNLKKSTERALTEGWTCFSTKICKISCNVYQKAFPVCGTVIHVWLQCFRLQRHFSTSFSGQNAEPWELAGGQGGLNLLLHLSFPALFQGPHLDSHSSLSLGLSEC